MAELGVDEVYIDRMSGRSVDRPACRLIVSFASWQGFHPAIKRTRLHIQPPHSLHRRDPPLPPQLHHLGELSAFNGFPARIMSGRSVDRPELKKLMEYVRRGDTVIVESIRFPARINPLGLGNGNPLLLPLQDVLPLQLRHRPGPVSGFWHMPARKPTLLAVRRF